MRTLSLTFSILVLISSTGCANRAVEMQEKVQKVNAPEVRTYSPEIQKKAAIEVRAGSCPVLTMIVADGYVMRQQSRILKTGKPKPYKPSKKKHEQAPAKK